LTGGWRRSHNEELHNLQSSRGIVKLIKSRSVRWVGNEMRVGKIRHTYDILIVTPEGKLELVRTRRSGRIILKWILRKLGGLYSSGSR